MYYAYATLQIGLCVNLQQYTAQDKMDDHEFNARASIMSSGTTE